MKVITVASRKGGSSKTTLCVHLAGLADAEGGCVIVDADPQGSASVWYELRESERPFVIPASADNLREMLDRARQDGFAYALVDCPPHNESSISEAMRAADLIAVPVRPSLFDLRAAEATFSMAEALKRPAVAVITGAPPPMTGGEASIVREARGYLEALGATVCNASIGQRAAFAHALLSGSSAAEYEPGGKASKEAAALWRELKDRMQ
jgi:chromosome partitioning protein